MGTRHSPEPSSSPGINPAQTKFEQNLPDFPPAIEDLMTKVQPSARANKRTWADYDSNDQLYSEFNELGKSLDAHGQELWQEFEPDIIGKLKATEGGFDRSQDALPPSIFWSEVAGEIKTEIRTFINGFTEILQRPQYDSSDNTRLKRFISGQINVVYPTARVLGFRGTSGAGKSSLINSLLNQELTDSGSDGSAMTSVCIQIKQKDRNFPSNFRATIEIKDDGSLSKMFQEWVSNYHLMQMSSEKQAANTEEEILNHVEQKGEATISNLTAMFCDQADFESTEATTQWLDKKLVGVKHASQIEFSHHDSSYDKVVHDLLNLSRQLLRQYRASESKFDIDCDEANALCEKLRGFTRSVTGYANEEEFKGSPWPLVKRVTIFTNISLLRRGLVLCDLPGLLDTNVARTTLTKSELRQCSDIAVVADVSRVVTDENVANDLKASFKSKGGRVMLVLTKTDNLTVAPDKVQTKLREHGASQALTLKSQRLTALSDCIQNLFPASKPQHASGRFRASNPRANKWIGAIYALQKDIVIEARNESIHAKMCQRFKNITNSSKPLAIHFVSNSEYTKYVTPQFDNATPISFKLTGISALRASLAEPFEDTVKRALYDHVTTKLSCMLDVLDIYSSSDPDLQLGKIESLIKPKTSFWASLMAKLVDDLHNHQQELVVNSLRLAQKDWSQAAANHVREWFKQLSWQKFNAMIKSEGKGPKNKPKSGVKLDWNKTFFELVVEDCEEAFGNLKSEVEDLFIEYKDKIEADLEDMRLLDDYPSRAVRKQLETAAGDMMRVFDQFKVSYWQKFRQTEAEVTVMDSESVIYEATGPMFNTIIGAYPKGKKGVVGLRREMLISEASKGTPFESIMNVVEKTFYDDIHALGNQYGDLGQKVIQEMFDRLSEAMAQHQDQSSSAITLRAKLREKVSEARRMYENTLLPAVNELMGHKTIIKREPI